MLTTGAAGMEVMRPLEPSQSLHLFFQRQVVDKRVWRELVTFFPAAVSFRADSPECLECHGESANERQAEDAVKKRREEEIALPVLKALYSRKTGVRPLAFAVTLVFRH